MSLEFSQVPLSQLSVGAILSSPIFDVGGTRTKLLGKNIEINDVFLRRLNARGVASVSVSKRDLAAMSAGTPQGIRQRASDHSYTPARLATEYSDAMDSVIQSTEFDTEIVGQVDRSLHTPDHKYDDEAVAVEVGIREQQVTYVENLFVKMIKGDGAGTEALFDVCQASIQSVLRDKDLFSRLGVNPYDGDYPSRHSLHVCSVAISMGVVMGLDDKKLTDLGTGCLIHDLGMLKLGSRFFRTKRKLSQRELAVLFDHPVLTMEAIACPGARLSPLARIVAYQIHERCNGSGYPRGTTGDKLHVLSRIAAVADAYVALMSNRWHRRGMMPYYAMEKMLKSIPQGLFDPNAVRALLQTVSLFPLGSLVETTDGRIGRVIRATGETYMQPIIELWNPRHKLFEPDLVNLVEQTHIKIKRAVAAP